MVTTSSATFFGSYLWWTDESGKRRKVSTRSTRKPEALQFFREFNLQEEARRRALKPVSLTTFRTSFLDYSRKIHTTKTVEANETALNVFSEFVGAGTAMHTITPADCERFLAFKTSDASAWSARKYRLALAAMFERAKSWGYVLENPWRRVAKPKPPQVLPAFFSRDEFKKLVGVIQNRDFRDVVTAAAFTGLRLGELAAMSWDWFDFSRRTITVKNLEAFRAKSGKARVVPLCDEAFTVLVARRESSTSALVFHRTNGRKLDRDFLSKRTREATKAAGLSERFHFHSLRHSFASWLVQGGVSLYQVRKLLGHSSTSVTDIYAHLVPSELHAAVMKLSEN